MHEHDRTFRAMPSFQRYRMYQEVNNLEWTTSAGKHCLTHYPQARDAIIDLLENVTTKNGQVVWGKMRTILKNMNIAKGVFSFNFETPKRKGFDANLTSNIMQHEDYVGPDWHNWDLEKQDCFIDLILDDELDDLASAFNPCVISLTSCTRPSLLLPVWESVGERNHRRLVRQRT